MPSPLFPQPERYQIPQLSNHSYSWATSRSTSSSFSTPSSLLFSSSSALRRPNSSLPQQHEERSAASLPLSLASDSLSPNVRNAATLFAIKNVESAHEYSYEPLVEEGREEEKGEDKRKRRVHKKQRTPSLASFPLSSLCSSSLSSSLPLSFASAPFSSHSFSSSSSSFPLLSHGHVNFSPSPSFPSTSFSSSSSSSSFYPAESSLSNSFILRSPPLLPSPSPQSVALSLLSAARFSSSLPFSPPLPFSSSSCLPLSFHSQPPLAPILVEPYPPPSLSSSSPSFPSSLLSSSAHEYRYGSVLVHERSGPKSDKRGGKWSVTGSKLSSSSSSFSSSSSSSSSIVLVFGVQFTLTLPVPDWLSERGEGTLEMRITRMGNESAESSRGSNSIATNEASSAFSSPPSSSSSSLASSLASSPSLSSFSSSSPSLPQSAFDASSHASPSLSLSLKPDVKTEPDKSRDKEKTHSAPYDMNPFLDLTFLPRAQRSASQVLSSLTCLFCPVRESKRWNGRLECGDVGEDVRPFIVRGELVFSAVIAGGKVTGIEFTARMLKPDAAHGRKSASRSPRRLRLVVEWFPDAFSRGGRAPAYTWLATLEGVRRAESKLSAKQASKKAVSRAAQKNDGSESNESDGSQSS